MPYIVICPKCNPRYDEERARDAHFVTTASVLQEWRVGYRADFIDELATVVSSLVVIEKDHMRGGRTFEADLRRRSATPRILELDHLDVETELVG